MKSLTGLTQTESPSDEDNLLPDVEVWVEELSKVSDEDATVAPERSADHKPTKK